MPKHKQVQVKINEDIAFKVDSGMEDIIKILWDNGIITLNSCISNREETYIQFASCHDFETLTTRAFHYHKETNKEKTLFNFFNRCGVVIDSFEDDFILDGQYTLTGELMIVVRMRFKDSDFDEFKELLLETLGE